MINHCSKNWYKTDRYYSTSIKEKNDLNSFQNIVGCYGKIVKFEETDKKTYLISLKGLSRFRIKSSYLTEYGYINSHISKKDFKDDQNNIKDYKSFKFLNSNSLKTVLKSYLNKNKLSSNWDYINATTNLELVNQLAMICPFSAQEKQMLLESHSINDRYILLTSILQNKILSNEEKTSIKH